MSLVDSIAGSLESPALLSGWLAQSCMPCVVTAAAALALVRPATANYAVCCSLSLACIFLVVSSRRHDLCCCCCAVAASTVLHGCTVMLKSSYALTGITLILLLVWVRCSDCIPSSPCIPNSRQSIVLQCTHGICLRSQRPCCTAAPLLVERKPKCFHVQPFNGCLLCVCLVAAFAVTAEPPLKCSWAQARMQGSLV